METLTFKVTGMTCNHCQRAVTQALEGVPGVLKATVDLDRAEATVSLDTSADQARLREAVEEAGYEAAV